MPKLKTSSGSKKRFRRTGSGFKRKRAFRNHILTKKSTKRKRQLRTPSKVHWRDLLSIKRLLGLR